MSFLHAAVGVALTGFTLLLLLLFALSCITIFIWLYNWQVFVLTGTSIVGLLVAGGYAWLCVAYYEPYLHWFETIRKMDRPAVSQAVSAPIN
jgi:O-antigen ligase